MNDQISSDEKNIISIISLMERWAPVVYFHPKENYFPSSVEFYLNSVQLVDETETKKRYCLH